MTTGSHAQAALRKQNVMDGRSGFRLQAKQHIAWLPARSKAQVRFLILLFKVPQTFRGVKSVSFTRRRIDVLESGSSGRKLSVAADRFL
jgi:hypothetical protein